MLIRDNGNQTALFKIDKWDGDKSGWFYIQLKVNSDQGSWECTDPFWQVKDIPVIINWFRDWAENKSIKSNLLRFIEPNISFEIFKFDARLKRLRIYFRAECRPKPPQQLEYYLDFALTNDQLINLSNDLSDDYRSFIKEEN